MTKAYYISDRALESIQRECRRYPDTETGGILVGFRSDDAAPDNNGVIITPATGPGPESQMSSGHFVKDTPYLQRELEVLFQYHRINYLGVWHKHPPSLAEPSSGDVVSAMEELEGGTVDLTELITPIAVVRSGIVEVHPHVISDGRSMSLDWRPVPHDDLPNGRSVAGQWHETDAGQRRLADETDAFDSMGLKVEVRQGGDGTYRFHAPLVDGSGRVLVFLCQADYPVTPPSLALYDPGPERFMQLDAEVIERWDIDKTMAEAYQGLWSVVES